jgi:hypothetical protein
MKKNALSRFTIALFLLCHGGGQFNLIRVSQVLRARTNSITFSAGESRLEMNNDDEVKTIFELIERT